jgi:hypothetical protein
VRHRLGERDEAARRALLRLHREQAPQAGGQRALLVRRRGEVVLERVVRHSRHRGGS